MKIRSQLTLLILGIVIIPLLTLCLLPVYHYMNSPMRFIMKDYKQLRRVEAMDLTEKDWDELKRQLRDMPPNVQVLVYYDGKVQLSTMQEFKAGSVCPLDKIFELIRSTGYKYNYQFQTPFRGRESAAARDDTPRAESGRGNDMAVRKPADRLRKSAQGPLGRLSVRSERDELSAEISPASTLLVISRSTAPGQKKKHQGRFLISVFASVCLFEAFCITLIIITSRSITKSITLLEKTTKKIADGDLDTRVEGTEKNHSANEITSLAVSLEKMRESLKDDKERRAKFIMGISHDLHTPVALIKGYTEALTDGIVTDPERARKSLAIIHSKADQLETMINDLINYARLNNTDWRQTLEAVELLSVLRDFADSAQQTCDVYKRRFSLSMDVPADMSVPMDKNLFSRMLENIFSNALRYTADGDSIALTAQALTDEAGKQCVRISIKDSGSGIEEKDLERIWDLFYRGTNSRREQGSGIGLSVVKTIADSHGWTLGVKSSIGEGSEFTVSIPV